MPRFTAWPRRSSLLEHLHNVGEGWGPILVDLHNAVVAIDPEYDVADVKEKWGWLNVWLWSNDESGRVHDLIQIAEEASKRTCEQCGAPGQARGGGWIKTLCDDCYRPKPLAARKGD